jgi:hypothetical protein
MPLPGNVKIFFDSRRLSVVFKFYLSVAVADALKMAAGSVAGQNNLKFFARSEQARDREEPYEHKIWKA